MHSLVIKDKQFYKKVASISIPIALQGLITTGVNMMDNVMVSNLGEMQLSGVSLANQFINIFHIFCMGIGMGASVLVARYYGMKDGSSLKKTVSIMLRLCVLIASIFCIFTAICPELIMRIYTENSEIIAHGIDYLRYSVVTYYFLGFATTCTIVLRNTDQVKIPLFTAIAAFFVNIGANYIFIYGVKIKDFVILEQMGVAGAAVGTLVARLFEFSVICGFLFFKDNKIGFRLKDILKPVGAIWKEYIRISIPVLISDGILALGNNSVAMVIGRLDGGFVAANTVTTTTQQLSSVMIQGFSQAGAIVTGHTLGEGERDKAFRQGYAFLGVGLLFGLISAGVILLLCEPILYIFGLTDSTKEIARELMLSISVIIVFQATNSIMTKGVLRGGGDTKMLVVADNIFMWIAALPLGILAGFVFHLPAFWIYFALKSDQVLKAIWCVYRLSTGKWIKKIKSSSELEKS